MSRKSGLPSLAQPQTEARLWPFQALALRLGSVLTSSINIWQQFGALEAKAVIRTNTGPRLSLSPPPQVRSCLCQDEDWASRQRLPCEASESRGSRTLREERQLSLLRP